MKKQTLYTIAIILIIVIASLAIYFQTASKNLQTNDRTQNISNVISSDNIKIGSKYGSFAVSSINNAYNAETGGIINFQKVSNVNIILTGIIEKDSFYTVFKSPEILSVLPRTDKEERSNCAMISEKQEIKDKIANLKNGDSIRISLQTYTYDNRQIETFNTCNVDMLEILESK